MLKHRLERDGAFLFRWRSFLPLVLIPAALPALAASVRVEAAFGPALDQAWMVGCLVLAFAGLALRGLTVGFVPTGTSGRNTRAQRADRLNTTGLYSVVRNPLYLANGIVIMAIALALKVWWFAGLVGLAYGLYIERIVMAEEAYLERRFGDEYRRWAGRTPAFLPRLSGWQAPDLAFSLRMVLRREYNGLFAIISAFVAIEAITDLLVESEPLRDWLAEDRFWVVLFGLGALAFVVLRTLKKRTTLLVVPPRAEAVSRSA